MTILINKTTKDSDLKEGLQVCYKDIDGAFTQLGVVTDILTDKDGIKNYLINTSMGAYMAEELKLIEPDKLNSVKVLFADTSYNYMTNVSAQSTEQSVKEYFVGKRFNLGAFPIEDMQVCTGVEFINNNL